MHDSEAPRSWLAEESLASALTHARRPNLLAYTHPYGFVVVRLPIEPVEGWIIRLHIWPSVEQFAEHGRTRRTADQLIHSHGWNIWSKVLSGRVNQVSYEGSAEHEHLDALNAYRVASDPGTGLSRLEYDHASFTPRISQTQQLSVVDPPFLIRKGEFHQTYPVLSDRLAATLVATEVVARNTSLVLAPKHVPRSIDNRREPVVDLQSLLTRLEHDHRKGGVGER